MYLLILKIIHILFVISWMAGVFYLPRILVHYKIAFLNGETTLRLTIMAQKLFRFSVFTGVVAFITGLMLGLHIYQLSGGWLHGKIMVVLILWGYFAFCGYCAWKMDSDSVPGSVLFWRIYNELALVFLVVILSLVVIKPF